MEPAPLNVSLRQSTEELKLALMSQIDAVDPKADPIEYAYEIYQRATLVVEIAREFSSGATQLMVQSLKGHGTTDEKGRARPAEFYVKPKRFCVVKNKKVKLRGDNAAALLEFAQMAGLKSQGPDVQQAVASMVKKLAGLLSANAIKQGEAKLWCRAVAESACSDESGSVSESEVTEMAENLFDGIFETIYVDDVKANKGEGRNNSEVLRVYDERFMPAGFGKPKPLEAKATT